MKKGYGNLDGLRLAPQHESFPLFCTSAGRVAAKQRGIRFGRPKKMNEEQKLLAKRLLEENKSVSEIAKTFNVHKATIYRLQD